MKKYTLCTLAAASTLILTACSNSHGGNEINNSHYLTEKPSTSKPTSNQTTTETTKPSTEATKPSTEKNTNNSSTSTVDKQTEDKPAENKPTEKPSTSNPSTANIDKPQVPPTETISLFKEPTFVHSNNGPLTGAIITLKANGTTTASNPINDGKEELNELVIDDKRILLFNSRDLINGNGMDGFKTLSNDDVMKETPTTSKISGYVGGWGSESEFDPRIFTNMRFGVINIDNESALFIQGYQTPETNVELARSKSLYPMPKSGKFLYNTGHALYGKEGNYQQLNAEVVADFSNKQLEVALKENNTSKLEFTANIEGNTFNAKNNGIEAKGAFYGSQANEVGGIFYQTEGNDKGKNGVFGAVDARKISQ